MISLDAASALAGVCPQLSKEHEGFCHSSRREGIKMEKKSNES